VFGVRSPGMPANAPVESDDWKDFFSNSRAASFGGAEFAVSHVEARRLVLCRRRWSRRDSGGHPDNRRGPHRPVHRVSSSLSLPPRRWFRHRRRGARSDLRAVVRHVVGGGDPAAGEWVRRGVTAICRTMCKSLTRCISIIRRSLPACADSSV